MTKISLFQKAEKIFLAQKSTRICILDTNTDAFDRTLYIIVKLPSANIRDRSHYRIGTAGCFVQRYVIYYP